LSISVKAVGITGSWFGLGVAAVRDAGLGEGCCEARLEVLSRDVLFPGDSGVADVGLKRGVKGVVFSAVFVPPVSEREGSGEVIGDVVSLMLS
jgi:hypothetical protein